jgi:hypothetical protein
MRRPSTVSGRPPGAAAGTPTGTPTAAGLVTSPEPMTLTPVFPVERHDRRPAPAGSAVAWRQRGPGVVGPLHTSP